MLEIRTNCENCSKHLSYNSEEAMICSFECTFCKTCVEEILENVCPNCGGGFEKRPVRPKASLLKYPASDKKIVNNLEMKTFFELKEKNKNISPYER